MPAPMDIANDLMANLRSRISPAEQRGASKPPCWAELHARLSAAHAAAGELLHKTAVPVGGFVQWQSTGRNNPSGRVNLTDLADGKADIGNQVVTAGAIKTGGRG